MMGKWLEIACFPTLFFLLELYFSASLEKRIEQLSPQSPSLPFQCALVHSQGLSLLPSPSINHPYLPYLSSGYEPGSQGISILLYCTLTIVDFTCHLQVCRPQNANPWRNNKMQRGLVTTTTDPSTSNQI